MLQPVQQRRINYSSRAATALQCTQQQLHSGGSDAEFGICIAGSHDGPASAALQTCPKTANAPPRRYRTDVVVRNLDVIKILRLIPTDRVQEMQQTIARNAHRLAYGIGKFPNDAIDILLEALHGVVSAGHTT